MWINVEQPNWIYTSIIEMVAVCITACVAWWDVNTWRRGLISGRKAALTEETLAAFYQARDLLNWVRMPGSFAGEGDIRSIQAGEDDETRRERSAYYVPIERLHRESEFWSRFDASRYRFMAVFGAEAASPFEKVRSIRIQIETAARSLIRMTGSKTGRAISASRQKNMEKWEDHIGWGTDKKDEVIREIEY